MSAEKIQRALNKWTVEEIADGYYRFNDLDDHDLDNILKAFDIDLPRKLYKRSELRSLKGKIKLQMGT
jgi:hypothetical protein